MKKIENYIGKNAKILRKFENPKYIVALWETEDNNMTIYGTSYMHKTLDNNANHNMYISYETAEKMYNDILIILTKLKLKR